MSIINRWGLRLIIILVHVLSNNIFCEWPVILNFDGTSMLV